MIFFAACGIIAVESIFRGPWARIKSQVGGKRMYDIHERNLHQFAYTNAGQLSAIRGVVVNFHGLNRGLEMMDAPDRLAADCTGAQLLYIFPYLNPWCWMNAAALHTVDRILDAAWRAYELPSGLPLCSAGRSMGGQCALIYSAFGARRPASCAVNCPVCDMHYHYSERSDVPRTMYSAFCGADVPIPEAISRADPRSQLDRLPSIPYYFVHCEADTKVSKQRHSDVLVESMRARGLDVQYVGLPGRDHIDLTPEAYAQLFAFIRDSLCGAGC